MKKNKLLIAGCLVGGLAINAACISGTTPTESKIVPESVLKPIVIPTVAPTPGFIVETVPMQETPSPKIKIKRLDPKPKKVIQLPHRVPVPRSAVKRYVLGRVGPVQFVCLDNLWTRESHWNYKAENKSSSAYGIPQALPGSKMASAGKDWRTNPITQVKWGIHYVNGRYGSGCGAWNFWQGHGWY